MGALDQLAAAAPERGASGCRNRSPSGIYSRRAERRWASGCYLGHDLVVSHIAWISSAAPERYPAAKRS